MSVVKNGAEISTPKKIAFICLTLGIALAVAVLIAEVVLRSFFIATPVKVSVDAKQYATIPGIYQPISTTTSRIKPNLPHDITINSLGYRGTDFSAAKPDGELRIFMAGDSFIFGDLVNDDQTLPHYLETTLRDECQKVRVVNGAMAGATITAHAALIKKAIAIKPDIVVLSFHDNDLVDLQSPVWNILEKNRSLRETFPFNLHAFLIKNSAIYVLAKNAYARLRGDQDIAAVDRDVSEAVMQQQRDLLNAMKSQYRTLLEEINRDLQQRGIDLFFIVYPGYPNLRPPEAAEAKTGPSVGWYSYENNDWAINTAQELGIPAVNLRTSLLAHLADPKKAYLFPRDGHPSPEGHRAAARGVAEFAPFRRAMKARCAKNN